MGDFNTPFGRNPNPVRLLLEGGADPNVSGKGGLTPIMAAAALGNLTSMRLLLDHGADVARVAADGSTALAFAVAYGQEGAVTLLLQHGADPNAPFENGRRSILELAKEKPNPRVIELLTQAGAK